MNMTAKKIRILISTYNGEKFLREQLDSIYNQTFQNFSVFIRDDGSTDMTHAILAEYQRKYANFFWYAGTNLGISKSIFTLMKYFKKEKAIYVFADQDDVWLPEKLETIISSAKQNAMDIPWLYCGETILTDDTLHILKKKVFDNTVLPSFGNSLIENICIGCTCAMNDVLYQLIVEHIPDYTVMYDWWFYLTAACFGNVIFDHTPFVLYRQHKNNLIGTSGNRWGKVAVRIKNFKSHKGQIYLQAQEFEKQYRVCGEQAALLLCINSYNKNYKNTWKLLNNKYIYRQKTLDNIIFKLLYFIHYI